MKPFTLLALACFLLGSCHKAEEGPSSASGRVVDEATGRAVSGATVALYSTGSGSNVLTGSSPQLHQSITAGADGHYNLAFEADESRRYWLRGEAGGYVSGSLESQPLVSITGGRKNSVDVPLRPLGYLRVRFLSPHPIPNTTARLVEPNLGEMGASVDGIGSPVDTVFTISSRGNQTVLVSWVINPGTGGGGNVQQQNVFCFAHDTTEFTIRF